MEPETLWRVYTAVRVLGEANARKVAELLGVSERTVQRYIRVLVEEGYVERVRRGMRVYYRVAKPLTREEAERLAKGESREREPPVYELAQRIHTIIREAGLHADLVGAAKIHLLVPGHNRITHDIDVVVAREHASALAALLEYGLGLVRVGGGVHADYRFEHPVYKVKIDVMVDGFREEGRLVWSLADELRRGPLTLEHALVAKLTRRSFEPRSDGYDVAVSLPHTNIARFAEIYARLAKVNNVLASRVEEHLRVVDAYIDAEFSGDERAIYKSALKRLYAAMRAVRRTADQRLEVDAEPA